MEWSLPLLKNCIRRSVKARHFISTFVCIYIFLLQLKRSIIFLPKMTQTTLRLTSWISELGKLSNILTVQGISETEKNTKSYFHDKIHMIKHIFFSLYNYLYKSNFVCFLSPFLGHWRVMLWFWIFFFFKDVLLINLCVHWLSTCIAFIYLSNLSKYK